MKGKDLLLLLDKDQIFAATSYAKSSKAMSARLLRRKLKIWKVVKWLKSLRRRAKRASGGILLLGFLVKDCTVCVPRRTSAYERYMKTAQ
ncbi:hypothetical protein K470DRAFT_291847 [Piedraia hortae CBS 480.64]|uniref:Uncharacterized protein n=1 Tax=Piedraia hortae CBS 480.64 TaxID=1314780 RepID=A0A6A7BRW7_9PEZI|nr:hypothetical protein K470DRAFT_291847 [Piedraia hortae CBS 480.64]